MTRYTALPYIVSVLYTIAETPVFTRYAAEIWSEEERGAFCAWLAAHPEAGDVIPGSGGFRKVRWTRPGSGKRGGARVIYYFRPAEAKIWLLIVYTKSKFDSLPTALLRRLKDEIEGA